MKSINPKLLGLTFIFITFIIVLAATTYQKNDKQSTGDIRGIKKNVSSYPHNYIAEELIKLNNNGAWSWFMNPRVIINEDLLIAGSVRSQKNTPTSFRNINGGNVEISVYNLKTGKVKNTILHPNFQADDHDAPSFIVRKDGSYLASYSKHRNERRVYYRISKPHNPLVWSKSYIVNTPDSNSSLAKRGNNVTYTNLFRLPNDRIYNFIRAYQHDPNYLYSDDDGITWNYGGRWLCGKEGYSSYIQYASDKKGAIHFIATEDHPREYDNSLYHGYISDGSLYQTNGTKIGELSTSTECKNSTWDFTKIFSR